MVQWFPMLHMLFCQTRNPFPVITYEIPDSWVEHEVGEDDTVLAWWGYPQYDKTHPVVPTVRFQLISASHPITPEEQFGEIETTLLPPRSDGTRSICHARYLSLENEPWQWVLAGGVAPKEDPLIQYEVEQIIQSVTVLIP